MRIDKDAVFPNGCRYPGDNKGAPAEVYNCRCSCVYLPKGVELEDFERSARNLDDGYTETVKGETYMQWLQRKQQEYGDDKLLAKFKDVGNNTQSAFLRENNTLTIKSVLGNLEAGNGAETVRSRDELAGRPSAVTVAIAGLNKRQQAILESLKNSGDEVTVKKSGVNMKDLSALTAKERVEFAMFTKGSERIIVRGTAAGVLSERRRSELVEAGYRFSGHTHAGTGPARFAVSDADHETCIMFGQTQRFIYDMFGERYVFDNE